MEIGSVSLYHGPGSEAAAKNEAKEYGLVLPFGTSGEAMKKGDARELVSLLSQTPIGEKPWGVVVGPLDEITPEVGDVLLKTIEEFVPGKIRPFLWAWDFGGVIPTLRSRTLHTFVPGVDERVSLSRTQADRLLKAYLGKNWSEIVSELKESKGDEEFVLLALVEAIQEGLSDPNLRNDLLALWGSVRDLHTRRTALTPARVLAAFLVGV